jgi:ubiquinone biosynthesis protein UbiJ
VTATPLAALELALNRLLALDAATLERLAALDGRLIVIESPTFGVALGVVAHRHGVQLMEAPQTADVRIRGRLSDLLRAQVSGDVRGLDIEGDKLLASAFAAALRAARIDWPQLLAPLLGDVLTQRGAQVLGGAGEAVREGAGSLLRSGAEFLQYERPTLVSAAEWDSFRAELHELHEAVAALERRVALLILRQQ